LRTVVVVVDRMQGLMMGRGPEQPEKRRDGEFTLPFPRAER
jgi:hypothetical protein